MIQKNRAGRHYYFYYYYYYYYKRTGWEAGGGTNTKTLSRGAQLVANCTKKTTISHTDTKVTSYSSICITGPATASAPRFNKEKKRQDIRSLTGKA